MTDFHGKHIKISQDMLNKCLIILVNSKFFKILFGSHNWLWLKYKTYFENVLISNFLTDFKTFNFCNDGHIFYSL